MKKEKEKEDWETKKVNRFSLLFVLTVGFLFLYQNCVPQITPEGDLFGERAQSSHSVIPFAYDVKVDRISYMSCSGLDEGHEGNTYYSFHFGAYGKNAGLRLTDDFSDQAEGLSDEGKVALLQDKYSLNSDLMLHHSIRPIANLYSNFVSSNLGGEGRESRNMFSPLSKENVAKALFKLGERERLKILNDLPLVNKNRFLQSYLYFMTSDSLAKLIRRQLISGDFIMSLTYVKYLDEMRRNYAIPLIENNDEYLEFVEAKKAEEERQASSELGFESFVTIDPSKVYGVGYQMRFKRGGGLFIPELSPSQRSYFVSDDRVLSSVYELNLETGQPLGREWECESFMIVRHEDNGEEEGVESGNSVRRNISRPLCPRIPENPDGFREIEGSQLNKEGRLYQALRSVLSGESWAINMERRCVVEKNSRDLCYSLPPSSERRKVKVQYDGGNCTEEEREVVGRNDTEGSNENNDIITYWQCPHYVSVCYVL